MNPAARLSPSLFLAGLLLPLPALADLEVALSYRYYGVGQQAGIPLLQALDRATPIRENGQTFHGYTQWNIQWRYRWHQQPDGRCRLTQNTTTLSAQITLPELRQAEPATQRAFAPYFEALRLHELGHVDLARIAARKIDTGVLALPEMGSCEQLEQNTNQLGLQLLEQARQANREYDRATGHGRTQGAWLPR